MAGNEGPVGQPAGPSAMAREIAGQAAHP